RISRIHQRRDALDAGSVILGTELAGIETWIGGKEVSRCASTEKPDAPLFGRRRQRISWRPRASCPRYQAVRLVLASIVVARICRYAVGERERIDVGSTKRLHGGDLRVGKTAIILRAPRATQLSSVEPRRAGRVAADESVGEAVTGVTCGQHGVVQGLHLAQRRAGRKIGRAHVRTPVTDPPRLPPSACTKT